MPATTDSPAVAVARAHVEAWSNHDFASARAGLAADVVVDALTTLPIMPPTHLTGIDPYMQGLTQFAQAVIPGSARILAACGDERNALLTLTVEADLGAGTMSLPGARLYLLNDDGLIAAEQVIFFATPVG
jgi:hypothetical protein